ncbi:hypothetical protein OUZ56_017000 [Daphnia magna]|uniref:Uncharacterized protein n=1 Tax=Daphnia magna TaxID=35525 RepID=A0ABR0ARY3_9CRUS|nr:hypothetical protein OUZ56_017000 [Daphnia magna]
MMLRHFKEEFIIKNSVNGGAPLSRWKLRDDAIPTLFLGYKDGVAPSKNCRKVRVQRFVSPLLEPHTVQPVHTPEFEAFEVEAIIERSRRSTDREAMQSIEAEGPSVEPILSNGREPAVDYQLVVEDHPAV